MEFVAQRMAELLQNYVRSIRTSMRNLESVAQNMAKLLHEVRKRTNIYLSSIFIQIFMQNLDSVAQDERVLLNFVIWWPFYFLVAILFFTKFQILFGLSIRTSMRNLDSVTQEMSELCSIL